LDILYISHCVPWPPDKGDRIRAFYSVRELMKHHRVHLACLARSEQEAAAVSDLRSRCGSLKIQVLNRNRAIVRGFCRFAAGGCFTTAFYGDPALRAHIRSVVQRYPIDAAVILSSAMAPYAPEGIPFIADWGDVDSEKRFQYARTRPFGFAQRLEAQRLRKIERDYAVRSQRTFLTTPNELELFHRIAPDAPVGCAGNGVNTQTFDPEAVFVIPEHLRRRKFLVFVGVLNYFPNSDGVRWFAENIFPELRRRDPQLELFVVGRHPARSVMQLMEREGITVTGEVGDVRPYLAAARAVVAPLRIARGIQNKVLEALAMGKRVLASESVCQTFIPDIPKGVLCCSSADDYVHATAALPATSAADMTIADAARLRFSWAAHLQPLIAELDKVERKIEQRTAPAKV
jgi:sugar transferase (PEP-CTERM/EpsH1 system associated)